MPDRTTPPPTSGFAIQELPRFEEYQLDNGIRLLALNSGDEAVSRITAMWHTGLLDVDNPAALGLMCNVISEGCDGMSGEDVSKLLESNGAWLKGAPSNHSTLLTLYSINSTANQIIPLFADIIARPDFPAEALESWKKKSAAQKEISLRKPSFQATLLARETLYGKNHPKAAAVMPDDIRAVTRENVVATHSDIILASRPTIFIAGKITDDVLALAKSSFGIIPFGKGPNYRESVNRKTYDTPLLEKTVTVRRVVKDSLQTGIRLQIPIPIQRDHPDYEPLRFATVALGGYFGSRLMSNIREDKGYTYGISANLVASTDGSDIVISCECDNRYADAAVSEIWKEIKTLAHEPMSDSEMSAVRNTITSALAGILDSPFSISGFRELLESFGLDGEMYRHQFESALSVKASQVMEMTRKYMLDCPGVIALAGGEIADK